MQTTVARRTPAPHPDTALHAMRAGTPWSTAKLGVVGSIVATVVAIVVDATTNISHDVIVLAVLVVGFTVSCRATARRPSRI